MSSTPDPSSGPFDDPVGGGTPPPRSGGGSGSTEMPTEAPPPGYVWVQRPDARGVMRWELVRTKDAADYIDTNPTAEAWADGIFNSPSKVYAKWADLWAQIKNVAKQRKLDPVALASVALVHLGTDPYAQTSAPMQVIGDLARLMARRDKRGVRAYDSIDDWYAQEVDPSGGSLGILPGNIVGAYSITWPTLPKKPLTEEQKLNQRLKREQAYKDATDPVVYIKGEDGKKQPLIWFGSEVRQSDFYRFKQQWDPIFLAYAGRRATTNELAGIILDGSSEYEVTRKLVNSPDFFKSPTWKSRQPEYATVAEEIFGTGYQPPKDLVKRAILNNWSGATFASFMRRDPSYTKSNEFQTRTSSLSNIYREIYGEPDEEALVNIREAAAGQWTNDQWAAYLRAQPGYTEGKEYQTKLLDLSVGLAGMLGVLPETPPATGIPNSNVDTTGPLPDSAIVEGSPVGEPGSGATGRSPDQPAAQPGTQPATDVGSGAGPTPDELARRRAQQKRVKAEREAREAAARAARQKYATQAGR